MPFVVTYTLPAKDYGAATFTEVIESPAGFRGKVRAISIYNVTEAFTATTTRAYCYVGISGDTDAFATSAILAPRPSMRRTPGADRWRDAYYSGKQLRYTSPVLRRLVVRPQVLLPRLSPFSTSSRRPTWQRKLSSTTITSRSAWQLPASGTRLVGRTQVRLTLPYDHGGAYLGVRRTTPGPVLPQWMSPAPVLMMSAGTGALTVVWKA